MKPRTGSSDMSNIEKSLEGLTLEDQVTKLIKKLADSEELNSKLKEKASQVAKLTKANAVYEKKLEKANLILLRTEEAKGKLEELCRELQKINKQVREDSINKVRVLEIERQQAVEQLRGALKGIEESMNEGRDRSDALAADNARLAEKLKELSTEYEQRLNAITEQYKKKEMYWGEYSNTREVEIKLLKTKLESAQITIQKHILEKEELTRSLVEGTARVGGAIENEKVLREQVKQYADRYSELKKSLSASNSAFDKFKKEIDTVNSNFKKVENDALKWKQKYEESLKNVLVLTMAKKDLEDKAVVQDKKLVQLEHLCRALSGRQAPSSDLPPPDTSSS